MPINAVTVPCGGVSASFVGAEGSDLRFMNLHKYEEPSPTLTKKLNTIHKKIEGKMRMKCTELLNMLKSHWAVWVLHR